MKRGERDDGEFERREEGEKGEGRREEGRGRGERGERRGGEGRIMIMEIIYSGDIH